MFYHLPDYPGVTFVRNYVPPIEARVGCFCSCLDVSASASAGTPKADVHGRNRSGDIYAVDGTNNTFWSMATEPITADLVGPLPKGVETVRGLAWSDTAKYLYLADEVDEGTDDAVSRLWRVDFQHPSHDHFGYGFVGEFPEDMEVSALFPDDLNGAIYALDASNEIWRVDADNPQSSVLLGAFPDGIEPAAPLFYEGTCYVFDTGNREIWCGSVDTPDEFTRFADAWPTGLVTPAFPVLERSNLYVHDSDDETAWFIYLNDMSRSYKDEWDYTRWGIGRVVGVASTRPIYSRRKRRRTL